MSGAAAHQHTHKLPQCMQVQAPAHVLWEHCRCDEPDCCCQAACGHLRVCCCFWAGRDFFGHWRPHIWVMAQVVQQLCDAATKHNNHSWDVVIEQLQAMRTRKKPLFRFM